MPHTLAQKILQAHTDEEVREAGQIVNCHLSGVLANDMRKTTGRSRLAGLMGGAASLLFRPEGLSVRKIFVTIPIDL